MWKIGIGAAMSLSLHDLAITNAAVGDLDQNLATSQAWSRNSVPNTQWLVEPLKHRRLHSVSTAFARSVFSCSPRPKREFAWRKIFSTVKPSLFKWSS